MNRSTLRSAKCLPMPEKMLRHIITLIFALKTRLKKDSGTHDHIGKQENCSKIHSCPKWSQALMDKMH